MMEVSAGPVVWRALVALEAQPVEAVGPVALGALAEVPVQVVPVALGALEEAPVPVEALTVGWMQASACPTRIATISTTSLFSSLCLRC